MSRPSHHKIQLYDYQREALDSLYNWIAVNDGHPLGVAPTASGKSVMIAAVIEEALRANPDVRILILTHVKELIEQNVDAIEGYRDPVGTAVYSAGLGRKESGQVMAATVQSVARNLDTIQWRDLIIVDECHLIPKAGMGQYRAVLDYATEVNPKCRLFGLTATPYRLGSGLLHQGPGAIFTDIAFDIPLGQLLSAGKICPLIPKQAGAQINTEGLRRRGGEFVAADVSKAARASGRVSKAAREIVEQGHDRNRWLVFCGSIEHAQDMAFALRELGVDLEEIYSEPHTSKAQRRKIIEKHRLGKVKCLVNVGVLTTGYNVPSIDLVAVVRPTDSPGLWVQICGRGMRTAPGKKDCLILDFGGNAVRHGPIDSIRPGRPTSGSGKGDPPGKVCPRCALVVFIAETTCPECGHEWPPSSIKHEVYAGTEEIMAARKSDKPKEVACLDMTMVRYKKQGKQDSVKVIFMTELGVMNHWLCFDHGSRAAGLARYWWGKNFLEKSPSSVTAALERNERSPINKPLRVQYKKKGAHYEVLGLIY